MSKVNFTDRSLQAMKPENGKRTYIWDSKLTGFGVRIEVSGRKSFVVKYRFKGHQRMATLDAYPGCSLAEARSKAHAIIGRAKGGEDPNQTDLLPSKTGTFGAVLDDYVAKHCATAIRANTGKEVARVLHREFLPLWKRRDIGDIGKKDVIAVLDAILARGTPSAANHAFTYINHFFNWSLARGIIEVSPCQGLSAPARKLSRERVLSDEELAVVWKAAGEASYPFGDIVRLLILTGQRRGEVTDMCWQHVDLEAGVWALPPEATKNKREHMLPLSNAALDILNRLPRLNETLVFPARGREDSSFSGFSKAKRRLSDACELPTWSLHDLRRTMATGMARLEVPPHVIERILNHVSGTISGVAAVYNRFQYLNEMRGALEKWATHVLSLQANE